MKHVTKDIGVMCDWASSEFLKLWPVVNFRAVNSIKLNPFVTAVFPRFAETGSCSPRYFISAPLLLKTPGRP